MGILAYVRPADVCSLFQIMQPAETWSVFEGAQNAALMSGLYLVTESSVDVSYMAVPGATS